ncbi:hypothetical protein Bhyg_03885, partial [Pseudolycoriella hygida]
SEERKKRLDALKKKGNYEFNTNIDINNGELIVSRRPNNKFNRKATDYSICHCCFGTYSKTSTRKHICPKVMVKGDRSSIALSRLVEGRIHKEASEGLQRVMSVMKEDEISDLVKYDWLLILFGNDLVEQYDVLRQHDMIRYLLRLLARLLTHLKQIDPRVTDFASIYNPQLCNSVIDAIRLTANFDSEKRLFKAPTTATTVVTQVKKVGVLLRDECIANRDKQLKEQTEDFVSLFTSRTTIRINKLATSTKAKNKREKVEVLPTDSDIHGLVHFLDKKRKECFDNFIQGFSLQKWIDLTEVTMASILLFNRRRVGDVQNTIITDYVNREKIPETSKDQLYQALTDEGKRRVQKYSRMIICGKFERPVPILLKADMEDCLDLILKQRDKVGIPTENELLFVLPTADPDRARRMKATVILKKFSRLCGAEVPQSLTGTKFRKHFANFLANKDVGDSTLTDVAKFMGHSVLVHKTYYRGNALHRDIAKMSELLEEAAGQHENEENFVDDEELPSSPVVVSKAKKRKGKIHMDAEGEIVANIQRKPSVTFTKTKQMKLSPKPINHLSGRRRLVKPPARFNC